MSQQRPPYQKPWLSHADQVAQLIARGLAVADPAAAEQFLSHINYFRFSGYCLAFEQHRHVFRPGATFEQVRASYDFDLALRDLVADALEIIEVDMRAAIAYHFGQRYRAFGHVDPANFFHTFDHQDWLSRLRGEAARSSELFVTHARNSYSQFPDLPVWMLTETISFGGLSKMFHGMLNVDKRPIAARYGIQARELQSWMHHLAYVRNLCAHHSRIWDRVWSITPLLPRGRVWRPPHLPARSRLFATLLILRWLLNRCPAIGTFPDDWRNRVNTLMQNPPAVPDPLGHMGILANWNQHPIWR